MGLENQAFSDQVNLDTFNITGILIGNAHKSQILEKRSHYITKRTIIIHLYTIYYMMKSTVH